MQVFDPSGEGLAPKTAGDDLGGIGIHRNHQRRVIFAKSFMGLFVPGGDHALG